MIKPILIYPDKRLRETSKEVADLTSEEFKQLCKDMEDTLNHYGAQGLSAIQIGVPLRVFVTMIDTKHDPPVRPEPKFFVNPKIVTKTGSTSFREGCLSFPGVEEAIPRASEVHIQALDKAGEEFILDLSVEHDGIEAIAVQHEMDHLDGVLFVDRVSKLKKTFMLKSLKNYRKKSAE